MWEIATTNRRDASRINTTERSSFIYECSCGRQRCKCLLSEWQIEGYADIRADGVKQTISGACSCVGGDSEGISEWQWKCSWGGVCLERDWM